MNYITAHWERLPRAVRGSTLAGLGATAATAVVLKEPSDPVRKEPIEKEASFFVGVDCVTKGADVSYRRTTDTYVFTCTVDGTINEVQALTLTNSSDNTMSVMNNSDSTVPEKFSDIVPIKIGGQAIDFDFKGAEGVVTVYEEHVDNDGINIATTGIARATN